MTQAEDVVQDAYAIPGKTGYLEPPTDQGHPSTLGAQVAGKPAADSYLGGPELYESSDDQNLRGLDDDNVLWLATSGKPARLIGLKVRDLS